VTLPRDTVYATVMIITTGVVGLCTMSCGLAHREQSFRVDGAGGARQATLSLVFLLDALVAIVGLAKVLSHPHEQFVEAVHLPEGPSR